MKFEWNKKHKYSSYPHVILGECLKAEEWFTGKYTLNVSEALFNKTNKSRTPRGAAIEVFHKTQSMELKIGWDHEWDRFTVTVTNPFLATYHTDGRWRQRTYDSKTIKGTLERIKTAIDAAMPIIIAEAEAEAEADLELNQISEKLGGVDLRRSGRDFSYGKKDSEYTLCFELQSGEGKEEDMFYIQDISGPYTAEEIRQIIEIVGGNPRALLEKLGVSK